MTEARAKTFPRKCKVSMNQIEYRADMTQKESFQLKYVYLFVCRVQFPAQGAGFLLQFPNVQDKRAFVQQRACLEHLETANRILHLEREAAHDR